MTLHAGDKAARLRAHSRVSPPPPPANSSRDEAGPSGSAAQASTSTIPSKPRKYGRGTKGKQDRVKEKLRLQQQQQQQSNQTGQYDATADQHSFLIVNTPAGEALTSSLLASFPFLSFTRTTLGQSHLQSATSGIPGFGAGADATAAETTEQAGQAEERPARSFLGSWGFGSRQHSKQRSEEEAAAARERFNADPLLPESPIRTQIQANLFQEQASKQDAVAQSEASAKPPRSTTQLKKQRRALKLLAQERNAAAAAAAAAEAPSTAEPASTSAEPTPRPSSSCDLASRISPRIPDLLASSSAVGSPSSSARRLSVTSHHTAHSHHPSLSSERSVNSSRKRKLKHLKNVEAAATRAAKSSKGKKVVKDEVTPSDVVEQEPSSIEQWVEASFDARPSTPPPHSMPSIEIEAPTPLPSQVNGFAANQRHRSPSPTRRKAKETPAPPTSSPNPRHARLRHAPLPSASLEVDVSKANDAVQPLSRTLSPTSPASNADALTTPSAPASITPVASPRGAPTSTDGKPSKRSSRKKRRGEAHEAEAKARRIAEIVAAAERGEASTTTTSPGKSEQSKANGGTSRQPKIAVQTSTPPRASPMSAIADSSPSVFVDCSPSPASATPSSAFARRQNMTRPASRCSSRARHHSKTETEMSFVTAKAGTSSPSPLSEDALMFSPECDLDHPHSECSAAAMAAAADDSMVAQVSSPPQHAHTWSSSACSHDTPRRQASHGGAADARRTCTGSPSPPPVASLPIVAAAATDDVSPRINRQPTQRNGATVDEEGSFSWDSPADKTATSGEWTQMTLSASVDTVTSQTPSTSVEDPDKTSVQDDNKLVPLTEKSEHSWWSRQAATTPTPHERCWQDESTLGLGLSVGDVQLSSPSVLPPSASMVSHTPSAKRERTARLEPEAAQSARRDEASEQGDALHGLDGFDRSLTPTDEAVHERNVRLMRTRVWAHSGPYSPPRFEENLPWSKSHEAALPHVNGALVVGASAAQLCHSTSSISALTLDGNSSEASATEFVISPAANASGLTSLGRSKLAPPVQPAPPKQLPLDAAALAFLQSHSLSAAQRNAVLSIMVLRSFKHRGEYAQQRHDAEWDEALERADEEKKRHPSFALAKARFVESIGAMPDFTLLHTHQASSRESRLRSLDWAGLEEAMGRTIRYVDVQGQQKRYHVFNLHSLHSCGNIFNDARGMSDVSARSLRNFDPIRQQHQSGRRVVSAPNSRTQAKKNIEQSDAQPLVPVAQAPAEKLTQTNDVAVPSPAPRLPLTAPPATRKFLDDGSHITWPSSPGFAQSVLNLSLSPESSVDCNSDGEDDAAQPIATSHSYGEASSSYSPMPYSTHAHPPPPQSQPSTRRTHAPQMSLQSHPPWLPHFGMQPVSSPGAMSTTTHDPFSLAYLQEKRGGDRLWLAGLECISEEEREAIEDFFVVTDRLWRDQVGDLAGEPEFTTPAQFETRRAATELSNASRSASTHASLYSPELERSSLHEPRSWAPRQHGSFASVRTNAASRATSRDPSKGKARSDTQSIAGATFSRSTSPVNSRPTSPRRQQPNERKGKPVERQAPPSPRMNFKAQRGGYAGAKQERPGQSSPRARRTSGQVSQALLAAQAAHAAQAAKAQQYEERVAQHLAIARAAVNMHAEGAASGEAAAVAVPQQPLQMDSSGLELLNEAQNHSAMVELYSEALTSPNHAQQLGASFDTPTQRRITEAAQAFNTPISSPLGARSAATAAEAANYDWAVNLAQNHDVRGAQLAPRQQYELQLQLQREQRQNEAQAQTDQLAFQIAQRQAKLHQLAHQAHEAELTAEAQRRREVEEANGAISQEEWELYHEQAQAQMRLQEFVSATINGTFTASAEQQGAPQQTHCSPRRTQHGFTPRPNGAVQSVSARMYGAQSYQPHDERTQTEQQQQQQRTPTSPANAHMSDRTFARAQSHQALAAVTGQATSLASEAAQQEDSLRQANEMATMARSQSSPCREQLQHLREQAAVEMNEQALRHQQWLAAVHWPRQQPPHLLQQQQQQQPPQQQEQQSQQQKHSQQQQQPQPQQREPLPPQGSSRVHHPTQPQQARSQPDHSRVDSSSAQTFTVGSAPAAPTTPTRPAAQLNKRNGQASSSIRTPHDASAWINSSLSKQWQRSAPATAAPWAKAKRESVDATLTADLQSGAEAWTESAGQNHVRRTSASESTRGGAPASRGGAARQAAHKPRWADVVEETNVAPRSALNDNADYTVITRGTFPHRPYGRGARR